MQRSRISSSATAPGAGVTPGFAILDDETARKLRREAIDQVIGWAARNRTSALGGALETAIAYAADDRFDEVLADALEERLRGAGFSVLVPTLVPTNDGGISVGQAWLAAQHGGVSPRRS